MIQRCSNPKEKAFERYGAKGITVSEDWKSFEHFFISMGPRPSAMHTVERVDGTKGYCKENCRWATYAEQNRNTSRNRMITFSGKTQCLTDWATELGCTFQKLKWRLDNGWSVEKAFTTPVNQSRSEAMQRKFDGKPIRRLAFNGVTKTLSEWAKELGIKRSTLGMRITYGWSVESALTT